MPLFDDIIQAIRKLLLAIDSVSHRQKLAEGDESDRLLASLVTTYEASELADMALLFMERRRDAKQGADERFCMELAASAIALGLLPSQKITGASNAISPNAARPATIPTPSIRLADAATAKPNPPTTSNSIPTAPAQISSAKPVKTAQTSATQDNEVIPISIGFVQAKWQTFLKIMDEKKSFHRKRRASKTFW
jgi:hypothetical protein